MSAPATPPAFPQNDAAVNRINNEAGMSLRDYFAAKAMQGFVAALNGKGEPYSESVIAEESYKLADALLVARTTEGAR